jgi:hypothetical protein
MMDVDASPNQTIYINNINEKINPAGKPTSLTRAPAPAMRARPDSSV